MAFLTKPLVFTEQWLRNRRGSSVTVVNTEMALVIKFSTWYIIFCFNFRFSHMMVQCSVTVQIF